ncbi:uncharacterized protein LOC142523721 [Primulina tabacum]|uniref:uncharacterized protein LOC142523721 n=1 Tax=Primulina tabacum TaxID=48773 RepID=UPI003F5920EB
MLSGWSTAGKQACPHCMSDSDAFTLPCSGKTSWFDNHQKFLPEDNPLRHNKTMFLRGRTKDNAKSRADLVQMGIIIELHPSTTDEKYLKANYTLDKLARQELFRWLKEVRFSCGYVSKMARCIDMNKLRIFGMKSHDCHVFMQQLIHVVFKELLPRDVWEALTELSIFFADLTSRNVKQSDMMRLTEQIPIIMCKLKKILPPSFFDSMEHLCIHLPYEAHIIGPVKFRWMYLFERYLNKLKKTVRNKAQVKGSICNAYLVKEAAIFCQHYFSDSTDIRRRKNGKAHESTYIDTNNLEFLSIFHTRDKKIGDAKSQWLTNEEYHVVSTYVLHNCNEIKPFVSMYENYICMEYPEMNDSSANSPDVQIENPIIKQVARGPLMKVKTYRGYCINGFNFHTVHDTSFKGTNNSGLQVSGHTSSGNVTEFYGKIEEIVEIEYSGLPKKHVVLFKCCQFDTHPRLGTHIHKKYKIVDVNRKKILGYYEPFVFAMQALQVVYFIYPTTKRAESNWMYVSSLRRRAYVSDVESNTEHNQIDANDAFQNNESGPHDISTQFLLTSQNLVDVNVMYDNEIDLNITESEREEV